MTLQVRRICVILSSICLIRSLALAQSSGNLSGSNPGDAPAGLESGGYLIHQSIEAGYRISDTTGSKQMYNTLVNLQTGPRILNQSLSMHSTTHQSLLFDNLSTNSFGWGGDPSNGLRFRIDKSRWYDFRSSFMRNQNYFDYNLLHSCPKQL
ncbi:MAG: hypothetical protein ACJ746_12520 [Bryobacteraceae bacterium]